MPRSGPPWRRWADPRATRSSRQITIINPGRLSTLTRWFGQSSATLALSLHERQLSRHGHHHRWRQLLAALPVVEQGWALRDGWLHAGEPAADRVALRESLGAFIPWRKGPLVLGGVAIETEWRSDWKWDRVAPQLDLSGARVLDVGAGNGYFGWRMLEHGAERVLGCDPSVLFVMQHDAIRHFAGAADHELLALRLEELPPGLSGFDAVFSMGVLYHRRDPAVHLSQLRERLQPGGRLVLETLILPDAEPVVLEPPDRYAGMRNVHALPSLPSLMQWLDQAGFSDACCIDITPTSVDEQRRTEWMPFHSLADVLDPDQPDRTCEGLPRPLRAMLVAGA